MERRTFLPQPIDSTDVALSLALATRYATSRMQAFELWGNSLGYGSSTAQRLTHGDTASMGNEQVRALEAAAPEETINDEIVATPHSATAEDLDDPRSLALSEPYVAQWSVLISKTNWEKGSIICAWRDELVAQSAPASAYSDEAWSRRVGGVTSQHVGRLRRVYQRFGNSYATYANLYWTHFLAALDWDDAEMWLEGASQSKWSISEMRSTRWQASGGEPGTEPDAHEIVGSSIDEDFTPSAEPLNRQRDEEDEESRNSKDIAEGPRYDGPDFGDEPDGGGAVATADDGLDDEVADGPVEPTISPFASLPTLPVDVADALEQFKLAIIRHRASDWAEFSRDDCVRTIEALRQFTLQ